VADYSKFTEDDLYRIADDDDEEAAKMEEHLMDYISDVEAEIDDLRRGAAEMRREARERQNG
jgi:hypothetical protein